jgi:amino acid transporter
MSSEIFGMAIAFFAIYHAIKLLTDFLLRRKLIKAGQYEKVGILEFPKPSEESNRYPSLKWGLVALMTGLGFILIEILRQINPALINYHDAVLPIGILLVFVSLGFLIYFFIMNSKRK